MQELNHQIAVFMSKKLEKELLNLESQFESLLFKEQFTVSVHA
jgi:hypothetical protein